MPGWLGNFETVTLRSGEAIEFVGSEGASFVWDTGSPGLIEGLQEAVGALRQYLAERSLDAGVRAAREGIESVLDYLGSDKRFTTARDSFGLDAGYYVARFCTNYDFAALDTVEQLGAVKHVEWLRHYNQHPYAREAFFAACAAGLVFTGASDEAGRSAGFWISHSPDPEVIAAYEKAGGRFTAAESEAMSRSISTRVA